MCIIVFVATINAKGLYKKYNERRIRMAQKEQLINIALTDDLWYPKINEAYPEIISVQYNELRQLASQGEIYGFELMLKTAFEVLIKTYVLTAIAFFDSIQDKERVSILINPNLSMSFGDWVNSLSRELSQHIAEYSPALSTILNSLFNEYNAHQVVKWRNDGSGAHGGCRSINDEGYFDELEGMYRVLYACFANNAENARKILYSIDSEKLICKLEDDTEFELGLYLEYNSGNYLLFDSLTDKKKNTYKVFNVFRGTREVRTSRYLYDLQREFFSDAPLNATDSFDEEFFTDEIEKALVSFHHPREYYKQKHYFDMIDSLIKDYSKGVFLLLSESGTGKSTFAQQIDGLGKGVLQNQGIICRCFYFSRYSFVGRKDFADVLNINFRKIPENGTNLLSNRNLPELELDGSDCSPDTKLADVINQFADIYKKKFAKNKLLLVLDGIDELSADSVRILDCIPKEDLLQDGIYILISCRSETSGGTYQSHFLNNYPFSQKFTFIKDNENKALLKLAVQKSIRLKGHELTEEQIEKVLEVLDNRFSGLPVVRALLPKSDNFEILTDASSLLNSYLDYLRSLYGSVFFEKLMKTLLTVSLAYEPLSIRQISKLALDDSPTIDFLAIICDIAPLLVSLRGIEGTKYVIGHPKFGEELREEYSENCCQLVTKWIASFSAPYGNEPRSLTHDLYIAGGVQLWNKTVLHIDCISLETLKNMRKVAGAILKQPGFGIELIRHVRLITSIKEGYMTLWESTHDPKNLLYALDALTQGISKYKELDDMEGCEMVLNESRRIHALIPENYRDSFSVIILFSNYENLSSLCSYQGNFDGAHEFSKKAELLYQNYPDLIHPQQLNMYKYNIAVEHLQNSPEKTIEICDDLLRNNQVDAFLKVRVLTLKSDALVKLGDLTGCEVCAINAVNLAKTLESTNVNEAMVYPNSLSFYGRVLQRHSDFVGAIDAFTQSLAIYTNLYNSGALPDRFEGSRILSHIGNAYYAMDSTNETYDNKEQCLWYAGQSVEVYRKAIEYKIKFQPANAYLSYINAAFAYDYYGGRSTALALLDELNQMQNAASKEGQAIIGEIENAKRIILNK